MKATATAAAALAVALLAATSAATAAAAATAASATWPAAHTYAAIPPYARPDSSTPMMDTVPAADGCCFAGTNTTFYASTQTSSNGTTAYVSSANLVDRTNLRLFVNANFSTDSGTEGLVFSWTRLSSDGTWQQVVMASYEPAGSCYVQTVDKPEAMDPICFPGKPRAQVLVGTQPTDVRVYNFTSDGHAGGAFLTDTKTCTPVAAFQHAYKPGQTPPLDMDHTVYLNVFGLIPGNGGADAWAAMPHPSTCRAGPPPAEIMDYARAFPRTM